MVNTTDAFQFEGLVEQKKQLEELMISNPAMEKKVRELVKTVLKQVRANMAKAAKGAMKSDPRQAYRAVRNTVYRQILGGNVNILAKKRAGKGGSYTPTRTLRSGQRGGNRRKRSERTYKLESYYGSDRGFILRFLNAGTPGGRVIKFTPDDARENVHRGSRGGNIQKYGKTINTGNRGVIPARNWFGSKSQREMEAAANNLSKYIDELIKEKLA